MPELGTAWVTLAISTEKAERDIKRAFSSTNTNAAGRRAGQQFSSGASQGLSGLPSGIQGKMASVGALGAKALGGAMTLGVAAVGAAVTGTLGAALSKGFDRLKSIDDAKFKLKALGNSAEDVQSIMDSALASVKGTAYGLGDAATIAASAVAAGVEPGEKLTAYLKLTADAAAVAGTSLNDMGMIINQVRTSGAAYTEDLNQLAGRGIPIYQWLGDEAGVAASEVKKLAAEGKISSEMLERAIQKNIGGAAKTMGQSFSGSVANAQAALGRLGEALLKPVFSSAPGGISAITTALDGMTAWINNNQGMIISFWAAIGEAAVFSAQSILQATGEITVAVGQLAGGIGNIQGTMLKIQSAAARFRGDGSEADRLKAESEAAFAWGEGIQDAGNKMLDTAKGMDRARDSIQAWGQAARDNAEVLGRLGGDASAAKDRIKAAFDEIPKNVPIDIQTPNGVEVLQLLDDLGVKINRDNKKEIEISAPMAPEVLATLESLGVKVRSDNGKVILVEQQGAEEASAQIDAAANKERTASISVIAKYGAGIVNDPAVQQQFRDDFAGAFGGVARRAEGAIVPMADGGLRQIEKPDQADIYAGRGAGTIFAEEETGGEAYIPLAPEKRGRSLEILAEVQRIFGVGSMSEGGITDTPVPSSGDLVGTLFATVTRPIVDALAQIRTALSSSRSSSSPMPVSVAGFDAALLARVPKGGSYDASGNLEQGLMDCSSAIEDLVNLMDGMPTAGREMATGNAAEWLASRGFMPTDTPVPGAFNVGFNDRHMEATLPGGTNVNFGSDASVASGGTSGAVGAWGDASFTQHYYRAVSAMDENTAAWSTLTSTTDDLNTAMEDRTDAELALSDAATREAALAERQAAATNDLGSSFGQSLMGGIMQSIGLDGSVFSDPTQWPNVKSAMALANYGGGLLQGLSGGEAVAGGGGMGLGGLGGFLKPLAPGAMQPQSAPDAPHSGSGAAPGPSVVVNGNIGMDPRAFTQRVDSAQNQSVRRNLSAVRPA